MYTVLAASPTFTAQTRDSGGCCGADLGASAGEQPQRQIAA
jgi:hypothetical protein